jgi:predicted enzyme related to lactoylglutathione lyase
MPNNLSFFVIHADDLPKTRRFYEQLFGWTFTPWGPPDFYLISTGTTDDPGIRGALQKRHALLDGKSPFTYECTIAVDDIDQTAAAVVASGGKILLPKCEIPTVGKLIKMIDPSGNVVCAMQYEAGHPQ